MKEDDMDEMMRKAAENYEVDAAKAADWNFVYRAVHEIEETTEKHKKKRRFAFWWLLLIPLGWLAHKEYGKFNTDSIRENNKPAISVQKKSNENLNNAPFSVEKNLADEETDEKVIIKNKEGSSIKEIKPKYNNQIKASDNNNVVNNNSITENLITQNPVTQNTITQKPNEVQPQLPSSNELKNIADSQQPGKNDNANTTLPANANKDSLALSANQDKKITPAKTSNKAKSAAKNQKKPNRYFYAGLIAGADISFVKYQKMQPVGYNAGLLVGYKLSKLSIESGVYFDKKNYYTSGKHFDASEIPYYNNVDILSVDGYCRMFEIPLNIKYTFIEKNKHSFFAVAGVSSYLMNEEFYNYDYIRNGGQYHSSRTYKTATQDWFSILNLSAGYELQTGKKTSLRIEPYFKAPLGEIGTGCLSISSAGLNIGVTRKIP